MLATSASGVYGQGAAPPAAAEAVPAKEAAAAAAAAAAEAEEAAKYAPPRLTPEQEKAWRTTGLRAFQTASKSAAPTNAETKVLNDAGLLFVDKLTLPSLRKDLWKSGVDPAKRSVDSCSPSPRIIFSAAIVKRVDELLKENPRHHPQVELNLVQLLNHLNAMPGSTTPPTPTVPYTPAQTVLIAYVKDPTRLLEGRILAAKALGRIGSDSAVGVRDGDLTVVQRAAIASALATTLGGTELKGKSVGQVWLRKRLVEALGNCGLAVEPGGATTYIDTAMLLASDPEENLEVRADALRAISQMNLPAGTNAPLILSELVEVVELAAKRFDTAAKAKQPIDPDVRWAATKCYLAFNPMTAAQAAAPRFWGLQNQTKRNLGGHSAAIKGAYDVCLPTINHILNNSEKPVIIPKAQIDNLAAWIAANPPADR